VGGGERPRDDGVAAHHGEFVADALGSALSAWVLSDAQGVEAGWDIGPSLDCMNGVGAS